jgi:hypothetical protein
MEVPLDVCVVPNGTHIFLSISRHCRAGLQIVPSLRELAFVSGYESLETLSRLEYVKKI